MGFEGPHCLRGAQSIAAVMDVWSSALAPGVPISTSRKVKIGPHLHASGAHHGYSPPHQWWSPQVPISTPKEVIMRPHLHTKGSHLCLQDLGLAGGKGLGGRAGDIWEEAGDGDTDVGAWWARGRGSTGAVIVGNGCWGGVFSCPTPRLRCLHVPSVPLSHLASPASPCPQHPLVLSRIPHPMPCPHIPSAPSVPLSHPVSLHPGCPLVLSHVPMSPRPHGPQPVRGGCRGGAWVRGAAGCRSCHCLPSIKMFQAESKAPTGEIIITKNLAPAK